MPFIVDRTIRTSLVDSLKKLDSRMIFSNDCGVVYEPVNTHPDIQIHFVNKDTAFVPPELFAYYRNILPQNIKLYKGNKSLGGTYPFDVAYNISRIEKNVILNLKTADEEIIKYYQDNSYNIINVKQGYAKCNICTNGRVAVTEDEGIYKALIKNGINALKIPVGSVALKGFKHGFIGGASGCFDKKILFCGHMYNNEVIEFFNFDYTETLSLDEKALTDYGSIIYFE